MRTVWRCQALIFYANMVGIDGPYIGIETPTFAPSALTPSAGLPPWTIYPPAFTGAHGNDVFHAINAG